MEREIIGGRVQLEAALVIRKSERRNGWPKAKSWACLPFSFSEVRAEQGQWFLLLLALGDM
jgi:hypothetical protein